MAWIRHGSLNADDPVSVELPDRAFSTVEVLKSSPDAGVYFRVLGPSESELEIAEPYDDCEFLPWGAICALEVDAPDGPLLVKLLADDVCDYSIRAS